MEKQDGRKMTARAFLMELIHAADGGLAGLRASCAHTDVVEQVMILAEQAPSRALGLPPRVSVHVREFLLRTSGYYRVLISVLLRKIRLNLACLARVRILPLSIVPSIRTGPGCDALIASFFPSFPVKSTRQRAMAPLTEVPPDADTDVEVMGCGRTRVWT